MLNANQIARQDLSKAENVKKNFEKAKDVYSRQNKETSDNDRESFLNLLDDMLMVELELQTLIANLQNAKKKAESNSKVSLKRRLKRSGLKLTIFINFFVNKDKVCNVRCFQRRIIVFKDQWSNLFPNAVIRPT